MAQAASQTTDGQMQALAGATSPLSAKNAYDVIQKGQGITTADGKTNQMPTFDENGNVNGTRDATAAEQAGGVNLSISIGASSSQSKTTQTGTQAVGYSVTADGDVSIVARGADENSNVTIQGFNVSTGNNIVIGAKNGVCWTKVEDGTIHRFSKPSNGETYWNESARGIDPIKIQNIPIEIRRLFKV